MNDLEYRLYKEMILWRAFALVLLVVMIVGAALGAVMANRDREADNKARAQACAVIEGNQSQIIAQITDLDGDVAKYSDQLQECSECHTHSATHKKAEVKDASK